MFDAGEEFNCLALDRRKTTCRTCAARAETPETEQVWSEMPLAKLVVQWISVVLQTRWFGSRLILENHNSRLRLLVNTNMCLWVFWECIGASINVLGPRVFFPTSPYSKYVWPALKSQTAPLLMHYRLVGQWIFPLFLLQSSLVRSMSLLCARLERLR